MSWYKLANGFTKRWDPRSGYCTPPLSSMVITSHTWLFKLNEMNQLSSTQELHFLSCSGHMWLMDIPSYGVDYRIFPNWGRFSWVALLSPLPLGLTLLVSMKIQDLSTWPLWVPRWLFHLQHLEEVIPTSSFLSFIPLWPLLLLLFFFPSCSPPSWPCHLCVGCHSFSTNCFPAGWSQGLRWCKCPKKGEGKEPWPCVESVHEVWNLQTNGIFTLSIWTAP